MFSAAQKCQIAAAVEKILLDLNHPEIPKERPSFSLHVNGAESWSFADIVPNWTFNKINTPGINPWNEETARRMNEE